MKKILTIAGSDSSGGAGIQADIKTITAHRMYAMSIITAITAQNTVGVRMVVNSSVELVSAQMDAVFEDIFPDSVKTGMMSDPLVVETVAEALKKHDVSRIVVDPVMVSTSGCSLISKDAMIAMQQKLMPFATIITPNIPEAEVLCHVGISSKKEMEQAGHFLSEKFGCSFLIKGGHLSDDASDVLVQADGQVFWYSAERINTRNTHGTGCTLSSAIACNLAAGFSLPDAVRNAKEYVRGALSTGLDLGEGSGPLNHTWNF